MPFRRLLLAAYLLLIFTVAAGSAAYFWQTRQEYRQLEAGEEQARWRLAEVKARLQEQEQILQRLRNDPAYVEMIIRRRLGYAKPDEFIFRFEDPAGR